MNVFTGVYAIIAKIATQTKTTTEIMLTKKPILVKRTTHNCLCVLSSTSEILKFSTLLSLFCLDILYR